MSVSSVSSPAAKAPVSRASSKPAPRSDSNDLIGSIVKAAAGLVQRVVDGVRSGLASLSGTGARDQTSEGVKNLSPAKLSPELMKHAPYG